jgi:hypothetical protein
MPVSLVVLLFLAVLSLFALPILATVLWLRERRFARLMKQSGRFIAWNDLEPRLKAGTGTLVVEQAQKDGIRVWWTPDDVAREAPQNAPAEKDLNYHRRGDPHPFVAWCFGRYLSPETGAASLTNPRYSYPPGFAERIFFADRYPKLQIVMTVKLV